MMASVYQYSLSYLDKIHTRCMKIIEFKTKRYRNLDIRNLMPTHRIQNIRQQRKVQLLSFMFNENKISENIKTEQPMMTLRSNNKIKFKEKFTRKTTVLNSPIHRSYALWNQLPEEIQQIDSLIIFQNRIKEIFYTV